MIRATVWHVRGTPSLSTPCMAHGRTPKNVFDQLESMRADDGNRTRMTSLEGWGSTIELHPRGSSLDERHQ
jgi:hypothetical protein